MTDTSVLKQGNAIRSLLALLIVGLQFGNAAATDDILAVLVAADGRLIYHRDELGNLIPDFSHCGYAGAERTIPDVPVQIVVAPAAGDDGARIQSAIDRLAQLPLDEGGFRGAVLLAAGRFEVAGQLRISASGIVLRGSGAGESGTIVVAKGRDRRTLVRVAGNSTPQHIVKKSVQVIDDYVPVGADTAQLDSTDGLKPGDRVCITRPSTAEWIKALGTDAFGVGWKPGTRDLCWEREIVQIDGFKVTFDAPITTAIEKRFGGASVQRYDSTGRITNIGIEHLQLQSEYDASNPRDEDHAWFGVTMQHVENAWVRCVLFRRFAGGAVALWEKTRHITVEDCISLAPVSENAGYRRHAFFTQGQLTLFLRCWSEHGRHDFAAGHCAAGPNAFVNCHAAETHGESGPIESWASGVLYDNVRIEGGALSLTNRWSSPPGAGWSAANCLLWQCQAATMHVSQPPTANNWAIGVWSEFSGDGAFAARSEFVEPISLYQAQLRQRRGDREASPIGLGLVDPIGSTNPTIAEAGKFSERSKQPARQLLAIIRHQMAQPRGTATTEGQRSTRYGVPSLHQAGGSGTLSSPTPDTGHRPQGGHPTPKFLQVQNGWLVVDGRLKTGGLQQQGFWRGTIRPNEAPQFGPAITRFVPGRIGTGFTDDLADVADTMLANNIAAFDHHYGLWYDRRRDDHTMVRRQDGNVVPPFYEQPFARTGRGKAWDGLSQYDLTKFNPWYWRRLHEFAQLCGEHGLVLFHQNYFQHNILEAGAHWADCPWRPANNVNDSGFPEPPPYIGDKRIFMASQFYDVTHPLRRELHRHYIRQCLENFADCANVIQVTSAEYSGPLEFTQFWLDTIIEWMQEKHKDVLVALSTPKDVQDAILADPRRGPHVDIIDIRYWAYTAGGELYAPQGGQNLAPRQHLRQTRQRPGGFDAVVRAVREYRARYPGKAVTYYADMHCPSSRDGWAVLIGGGSLPNLRLPDALATVIPTMAPADNIISKGHAWCLVNDRGDCLVYSDIGDTLQLRLPIATAHYRPHWIDPETAQVTPAGGTIVGPVFRTPAISHVLWLQRQPTD
jgi:hypothetical protein